MNTVTAGIDRGATPYAPSDELLRVHGDLAVGGDLETGSGVVDLAVNVRAGTPPRWLRERLAGVDLARYPDPRRAVQAIAARHGRDVSNVLITAGAAEAFVLMSRALTPRRCAVVHPQFTEPEVALRAAGHEVSRVVLRPPFTLDPSAIPADADLVVIGNPTNPTAILHPAATLRALARPGRMLVIDEAFADCGPAESESLARDMELPGLVVVRSLTKTWGLAGLRVGYLLAASETVSALSGAQPPWAVSAPALEACVACCSPAALAEAAAWGKVLERQLAHLIEVLTPISGIEVVPQPCAPFVLIHIPRTREAAPAVTARAAGGPTICQALRAHGFAVRRGDTFPGLGPDWIRVAVRDHETSTAFAAALKECV